PPPHTPPQTPPAVSATHTKTQETHAKTKSTCVQPRAHHEHRPPPQSHNEFAPHSHPQTHGESFHPSPPRDPLQPRSSHSSSSHRIIYKFGRISGARQRLV